jgi:hypothetical protein
MEKIMRKWTAIFLLAMPLSSLAQLTTGVQGAAGSTVGPGGAIYVTEGGAGRLSRIDPGTGELTPVTADGCLPISILTQLIGFGGAVDVAYVGSNAYVLVTAVGFPLGGAVDGIYRVDGWDDCTVFADIGEFAQNNPPSGFPWELPGGLQYSLEAYMGGFLVTDGHHNRIYRVTFDGEISEFYAFGEDVVPTGLDVHGNTVYLSQAGPTDHLPEDGKVVSLQPGSPTVTELGSGAPLLVDVEFGRGTTLFALSQGVFPAGAPPAAPALPNTGALLRVNGDGSLSAVVSELNQPTSLEIIQNDAYIVTLSGDVLKFEDIAGTPFGN